MRAAVGAKAAGVFTPLPKQKLKSAYFAENSIPASLCPAQITFIGTDGCGLTRQSFMVKKSPLKSLLPVPHRSRSTCTYSVR